MLILLPPSEGKSAPAAGAPLDLTTLSLPSLTDARAAVLDALVDLCRTDPVKAASSLKVPKTQAELVQRNAGLREAPAAPAREVYTGVLFDALGLATLSPAGAQRAATQVLVTSSLFGLVAPGDRIPAYRLSGDASLPGLGGVAGHWRAHLEPAGLEALGAGLLVDLRSSAYAAFWKPPTELAERVATVRVLHEHNGARKVVSHFNKATKGRIVRALLEAGAEPETPAALAEALGDLGWTVETGKQGRAGVQLDVVVSEL